MKINNFLKKKPILFFLAIGALIKFGFLDNYSKYMENYNVVKPTTFESTVSELPKTEPNIQVATTTKEEIDLKLKKDIERLKSELPLQNEDKSTIIDAVLYGDQITYTVITPLHKSNFTEEYLASIIDSNCSDQDTKQYLSNGTKFLYKFFDLNMNHIYNFKMNLDSCDSLAQANTV